MAKVTPLSGFPEWLPEQRLVEQRVLDTIRRQFELYGFLPLETRAVEPLEWLLKKGETDKEIYVLRRLQAEGEDEGGHLGLHFDLTVPFARYVAERAGQLVFPVKRYQIQKSWRGERPQEGRYREFYQADADVVMEEHLPVTVDLEMALLLHDVLAALPIPPVQIAVNNRKVLEGFYRGLGVDDVATVLRTVDKLDKIGAPGVSAALERDAGLDAATAARCLELAAVRGSDASVLAAVEALGVRHPVLEEGLAELQVVLAGAAELPAGALVVDLRIARGLDYYTGTVYEGAMIGHEALGSVCSGGRYDELVGLGGRRLPGVGVSIGVTRILGRLFAHNLLRPSRRSPACVLVAVVSEERRGESTSVARALRTRGIPCEVAHKPLKYGKQIRQAERKGIPFVWFPEAEGSGGHAVRDIRSGHQLAADPDVWEPPAADRDVAVTREPEE